MIDQCMFEMTYLNLSIDINTCEITCSKELIK
jgi:hypothetical protein